MKKIIVTTAVWVMAMASSVFAGVEVNENNVCIFKTQLTYNNNCNVVDKTEVTTKNCWEFTTAEQTTVAKPIITTEATTVAKPIITTEVTTVAKPIVTTEATTEATTVAKPIVTTEATTEVTTEETTKATTYTTTEATTEVTTEETTKATTYTTTEATTEETTKATTYTTTESTSETTTSAVNGNQGNYANELLSLVNKARGENGLSALTLNSSLSNVAYNKAKDMSVNNYFSHTSPTYGTPFEMIQSAGISYRTAGENIAKGQQSAEAVFNAWMNSEGHRANILNSSFTQMGIGEYNKHWCQMFIG